MANVCDYCDSTKDLKTIGNDTVCPDCQTKGINRVSDTPVNDGPININEVLTKVRDVDARIKLRTDLFNAETISINEIKAGIDADETITNKPYALAVTLQARYTQYKQVIFEMSEKITAESNKQQAIQVYLNNLANQLRADEREKLKINDINYQVSPVSGKKIGIAGAKVVKTSKKKLDKAEVRKFSALLGLPEFSLQMICIQKNLSAEDGYNLLKKSIDEAKASIPVVQNSDQN